MEKSAKSLANPILSDAHNIQDLKDIQYRFVIVPVDKASNNVSFVCKSFYKHILKEEIMKWDNFAPSNYTEKGIISKYTHLLSSYNIKDTFSNFIPFLYWIPKFHKQPIASRFISYGRHTAPNTLSKVIGVGLSNLLKLRSTISKNQYKYNNINDFFIYKSNSLNNGDNCSTNLNVKTYDFKTLYTNIPQSKLKANISKFVVKVFQVKK